MKREGEGRGWEKWRWRCGKRKEREIRKGIRLT